MLCCVVLCCFVFQLFGLFCTASAVCIPLPVIFIYDSRVVCFVLTLRFDLFWVTKGRVDNCVPTGRSLRQQRVPCFVLDSMRVYISC